jgi:ribosome biogenesis GTPase A
MESRYGIDYFDNDDIGEMYDRIGKRLGYIIRGGEIDYARVSTSVINDIRNENIKGITFDRL